ncbi:hypothetical protein [Novilysobacter spongiicola]|uniref:Uncharacterized protein n=1 Tax=Lysobacter spongiicola DSM 21749 TaxID=1122188 RepID=A0A1T4SJY5_9GAMM|nr:hypothetical protein [Lysobacter spongiicola]SKA28512.1 hypothetical protein SAMN02745674_02920 [Lysobacter spongiicola DSM 21749]
MIKESELDRAFADAVATSADFRQWVLAQTPFRESARTAILLRNEQIHARPKVAPANWWRHWWCALDDSTESETDIFLVFELGQTQKRCALHIENKPPHGKFTPSQYLNYRRRAEFMASESKYLNYSEFVTVILAPEQFLKRYASQVCSFDLSLSYEAVSGFVPLFAESLRERGGA